MLIFFFSSRRRHTRCSRDWSSDVCSSDLVTCCLHVDEHGISPGRFFQVDSKKGLAPIDRRRRSGIRVFVRNLPEGNALRVPLGGYLGQRLSALHFQKEQAPLALKPRALFHCNAGGATRRKFFGGRRWER